MRGRFAPSPTGVLHLGNLRTALLAWLFARSSGSSFVLRFEDLDRAAVRAEFYDVGRRDLERLGLDWDEELRQHDHVDRYRDAIAGLVERGLTYPCYCTRREIRDAAAAPHVDLPDGIYPGTCRSLSAERRDALRDDGRKGALRLRSPGGEAAFVDRQLGPVTARVDDLVLARRDGTPAYNLAVVVDDAYQGIEEVVRGDDLASSTPRQLLLFDLLGSPRPAYAHVPLVLNAAGERLAKRDGAVTLDDRVALGQSPREVLGLLATSLGLVDPARAGGTTPTPTPHDLLERFDPMALPRRPWTYRGP